MKMGVKKKRAYAALGDFVGPRDRPSWRSIKNVVHKFQETGSVEDVKTSLRVCTSRSFENIAAVRKSVAEGPTTSTRHRVQELHMSRSTFHQIFEPARLQNAKGRANRANCCHKEPIMPGCHSKF